MIGFLTTFATSFVLVLVAEMADKTQLLTLSLSCRYPARKVLLGVGIAIAVLNLVAVVIGALAGRFIPVMAVKTGAGVLFVGFGVWNLLAREKAQNPPPDGEECEVRSAGRLVSLGIAAGFLVAEIGDKTQLATLSLGARYEGDFTASAAVWLGATLGMLLANALAIVAGHLAGRRLPERLMKRISGGLFVAFGVWTLVEAFLG
jgi:putative Ca2+/H+ antiporter (TMEM165/GDT1 family)